MPFGLIAAGRLVDASPETVDSNKYVFTLEAPELLNHITCFLTGEAALDPGYAAGIFLYWPSAMGEEWYLLGTIDNDKPSAIFRVSGVRKATGAATAAANPFTGMTFGSGGLVSSDYAVAGDGVEDMESSSSYCQVGICIQPAEEISHLTPAPHSAAVTINDLAQFTTATVGNFYDFLTGFVTPYEQAMRDNEKEWVPLGALSRWREVWLSKLEKDPTFWRQ